MRSGRRKLEAPACTVAVERKWNYLPHKDHPKVPPWEQQVSAGCAAYSMTLAAEALGYAAVWRTGSYTEDPELVTELGGNAGDKIVAFLYIGTRDCPPKNLPSLDSQDFLSRW